jgi:hypothetical protein
VEFRAEKMRQLLIQAFKDAVDQIGTDMVRMPITRWNESVFRFIYSRAITKLQKDVKQFFECERIDLVLRHESEGAFVEFKFYIHSPKYDALYGNVCGRKGYPSDKNVSEFKKCVKELRKRDTPQNFLKLVALFYADPVRTNGRKYDGDYGDRSAIEHKLKLHRLASCGLFELPDGSDRLPHHPLCEK